MSSFDAIIAAIDWRAAASFGLVLGRLSGALLGMPVFGAGQVPAQVKALLLVLFAAAIFPAVRAHLGPPPADAITFAILLARELLLGFALGFAVRIVFAAQELAGQLIASQIGLTYGAIVSPESEHQEPSIATLFHALTVLLFLAVDGHHLFFRAVQESFVVRPPSLDASLGELCKGVVLYGGTIFGLGVQVAAPVIAAVLLSNVGLALAARAAPGLQVFSLSFAVTILVGLAVLAIAMPGMLSTIVEALRGVSAEVALLAGKP